ncbi:MAG: YcaO-like family protein [Clostridia bacterium]
MANGNLLDNSIYDQKEFLIEMFQKLRIKKIENIASHMSVNPTFTVTRGTEEGETTDCGKGLTVKDAFYSGLFESIERYSAENFDNIECEGSALELKAKYNLCAPSEIYPSLKHADKITLSWCEATNLLNNEKLLVPLECVKFPMQGSFSDVNTVGLASEATHEGAIVHAIYELVEHDTLSIYSYNGLKGRKIKLTQEDGELYNIYTSLIEKGISVDVRLLDNDLKIPTVLALFMDIPTMKDVKIAGMGSNMDIRIALKRALLECQQSSDYWYMRYKANDMEERIIVHPSLELYKKYDVSDKWVCTSEIEKFNFGDKEEELAFLLNKLNHITEQVIVVNITNSLLDVPCVKVIIPEFESSLNDEHLKERCKMFEVVINQYTRGEIG